MIKPRGEHLRQTKYAHVATFRSSDVCQPSCKNYYELNGKQFCKCGKYQTCDHDQNLRVVDALLWSS
jgi:hypothetical protein